MKKTLFILFFLLTLLSLGVYYYFKINSQPDYYDDSPFAGASSHTNVAGWIFWFNSSRSLNISSASAWWFTTQSTKTLSTTNFNNKIAFKVGADQDLNLFRENISKWHIPNLDVITYNGIFWDYHFNLPKWECKTMFCPLLSLSTGLDINNNTWYYVQVALGSNINKKDFKRKKTNFVIVIDKSGSMWDSIYSYYYKTAFNKNNKKCKDDKIYFWPWNKCITKDEVKEYKSILKNYSNKNKIDLVKKATIEILKKMKKDDRISVILFDEKASIAHPLIKIENINKEKFIEHVNAINANGGTNMESSFKKLDEVFTESKLNWYQNRVIFITDAMPNVDDSNPYSLSSYVKKYVNKWIYFTFIWVWIDFQQAFIQKLAKTKWTNYFFINNSYDIYRRLIDEFDYNFFPMVFNLSFKTSNTGIIEKVYWTDTNIKKYWEVFHINTLFPTPPTADGYRWSIILLKLKNKPEDEIKFEVNYENIDGEKVNVKSSIKNIEDNISIKKWVVLVNYVDTLKTMIEDNDNELWSKLITYLENNKKYFENDDKTMFEKEIKTIKKLINLLKNWVKVEKDYWQEDR